MALSLEGKRLATASDKGTLVRVWNTADGQLLQVRVMLGGGDYAACVSPARRGMCFWTEGYERSELCS